MPGMAKTKRSIDFTKPQLDFLAKEAKKMGVTIAEYVRHLVDKARGA